MKSFALKPMHWLLLFSCLTLLILAFSGCATIGKLNTDPVAQAALGAVVDVAVGEAVQKGVQPAAMVAIATQLEAFDTGAAVTVPALTAEIQALVVKANLNPGQIAAVQILEATLDALITQQLAAASSAPAGAISSSTITTINIVLTDVITAAQLYSAQPATTLDIPLQNKHFVLASVESPQMVGGAASLVLVASLQAFGHVSVGAPVAAALTVLLTAGAALIDELAS